MKNFLILFSFLFCAFSVHSQNAIRSYSDSKTDKWTVRSFGNDPLNVKIYTFKNGLQLITSTQTTEPRIYTMVAVGTGSANDPADHTGLAHYLEHMLFKGTDKYGTNNWPEEQKHLKTIDALYEQYNKTTDELKRKNIYHKIDSVSQIAAKFAIANEFDKMCQAMGASGTNAFTSNDMTCYINEIPSNKLNQWINLEAERYRNPILRLFHTELEAVYEEKNISLDKDNMKVYEQLDALLYPNHPYGTQTTIGTIEHLKNPSLQAIRDYFKKYYVPNNMAIIMCGDFNADQAAEQIEKQFAYMKAQKLDNRSTAFQMPYGKPQIVNINGPDAENVTLGFRIDADYTGAQKYLKLVDLLLSNSATGLIDANLVNQQKVQSAYSYADIKNEGLSLVMYGQPREGQTLEDVETLLLEQLDKIKKGDFDETLIPAIVLNSEISQIKEFENNARRAYFLMESYINKQGYQAEYNKLQEMSKITKVELMQFANEFFTDGRVVIYKREGQNENKVKIEKPEINPVELNRDKQSDFVKNWLADSSKQITPQFIDLSLISNSQLISGVPVKHVANKQNRIFSYNYVYEMGTYNNKLASIALQYLELAGTHTKTNNQISNELYRLGCKFSAYATPENAFISITGPSENTEKALQIVHNLLANTAINQGILDGIIQQTITNRQNAKLNPRIIASRLLQYSMYGQVNPANDVLPESKIKALKAEDILEVLKQIFQTSYTLEYFGPSTTADLCAVANKFVTEYKPKTAPAAQVYPLIATSQNTVYFTPYNQVQASIYWYGSSNAYNAEQVPVATAFNKYFGGDMSSVVFQSIRESKALAYSTFASYSITNQLSQPNYKIAFVGTQADKFHQAINGMYELINELPLNASVFDLSKTSTMNEIATARVNPSSLMAIQRQYKKLGIEKDPNQLIYAQINSIDINKIQQFHKQNWAMQSYHISVVADPAKISTTDLQKYGKVVKLSLENIFGY